MESEGFDPNLTMIAVNEWMDRWVSAGRIPSYSDRMAALRRLDEDSKRRAELAYQVTQGNADAIQSMRHEIDAHGLNAAVATPMYLHLGNTGKQSMFRVEAATRMRLALIPVALAIGGYHAEHGEYPPDLHALVPAYLDSLPTDFATGELPVYRVEDGVAIVYSLGTDLEDDGGVDTPDDPTDGDIVFRIQR